MMKIFKYLDGNKTMRTAPKAEVRYSGGLRQSKITKGGRYGGKDKVEIKQVVGKKPSIFGSAPFIRQTVLHSTISPSYNDTTYFEVPERKSPFVERKLRGIEKHPSVFKTYYSNIYPFFGDILPDLGSGTKEEYETLKRRFNTAWGIAKHQDGGLFKENLEPPTYGVMGELGRNVEQGARLFKSMVGSLPMQLVTAGLGAGIGGMVGPTVRIVRDVRNALGSAQGFRLATRKFSRNINARKGNPEFRWTKTSGDIRKGGVFDRLYLGMGPNTRRIINNASHPEGSGYSALPILDRGSSAYQWARRNPESVAGRRHTHAVAENNAYTSSNRVFRRNLLIDRARDWRNYIFE